MSKAQQALVLGKLRESLQELATSSLRESKMTALELASNFECVERVAVDALSARLSEMQIRALCSMQEYIDFMHTLAPRVWSDTAVDDHACWQQLKEMAALALTAFGWSSGSSVLPGNSDLH